MPDARLIGVGIFTIPAAAALLGVSPNLVRIWVDGHKGKQDPIIENELGRVDGKLAISFKNLMELQFVAFFVRAGIRLPTIRTIMAEYRRSMNIPHPFATKKIFQTDGKKILEVIARNNGIDSIYDLRSKNYEMHDIVMPSLKRDVVYDPEGHARIWFPRRDQFPNVIVSPAFSFGRPVMRDSKIPTSVIETAYKVERSYEVVSAIYDVSERRVREAVSFETSMRMAA
ncbi:MAG: hypothetical protein ABR878_00965 [Roseiarcus sp.]|jgi:uncharacterized protein (DUF433 family)